MRLVEEETRRYRPTKNYLEYLPTPKSTFEVSYSRVIAILTSACTAEVK